MNPRQRRLTASAAAALALAVSLSACGASADADAEAGASGGSISVAVTDPIQTVPGRQTVAYDLNMAVWSPLTWVDTEGELTYVAAESIDSDDATTWTVT